MKIKNLKYIFGVAFGMVLFFSGVSFGSNCCNSEYTENTSVCDIPDESHCQGSTEWYNNNPGYDTPPNLDWFLAVINEHWDVCDGQDVRKIQEKLNQIGGSCITCVDGKAGYHTRSLMSSCVSYACSSPKVVPNFENGELVCNAGYKAQTENGITCCVKMTINGPSFEQQSREDNDILTVYVTFSVESPGLTEGSLHCDSNKFNIDGGTLSEISADSYSPGETNVGCVLEISTPDSYEVTLTVNDGVVKMGDNESSNGSDTFTRDEPEPESEPESEPEQEPEQEPEPECPNPPDGDGNCALGYQNNAGCCESKCSGDKIYDPSIDNCTGCALGTIPNADNTKCVCNPNAKCCGIQLNTVVPFIGDCIEMGTDSGKGDTTSVTSVTAFPILMQGLMKILMSVIMVFSFIMVIVSGLMMTAGAFKSSSFDKGKTILKNVLISLILLGCSGLILSLINPSFFGG